MEEFNEIMQLVENSISDMRNQLSRLKEYENANRDAGASKCLIGYQHEWQKVDDHPSVLWCRRCAKTKKLSIEKPDL